MIEPPGPRDELSKICGPSGSVSATGVAVCCWARPGETPSATVSATATVQQTFNR
jgi:hypothetical protein